MGGSEKRGLCLETPAKVNVGLRVTGKRSDGYHELITIMVPVTLYDSLELIPRGTGISISCSGFTVPADEGNLAFRAAEAFFRCSGAGGGVEIRLKKGIPVAAGLGGGSSDAAATLAGLNRIYGLPLDDATMRRLALGLGADVPFFLLGRPALARGVGELLEPLDGWPDLWYLIVTPAIEVSTAWVYANLKIGLTSRNLAFNIPSFEATPFEVADFLVNDLEAVTAARFPVITRIKALLLDAGAEGALMSGSGPSVYGIFTTKEKAGRARERLEGLGRVFLARGIS